MEIVNKKIDEIIPYEKNPRKNDNAVEFVANSIKEFGFKVPVVIDKNNIIVAGHTRYKACKKLGIIEVPCIVADDLSEEQIKAFRLADNKVAEKASWDSESLQAELDELYGIINMTDFGFEVQIENIDMDEEGEEKIALELNELNDYVVLEFEDIYEWEKARELLGVERVATGEDNPKIRRHGFGRVIKGKDVLERLERLKELEKNEH